MFARFLQRLSAPRKPVASVRFLPAVMATLAALLGLKAVALAEDVVEAAPAEHAAAETAEPTAAAAEATPEGQCAAPSLAELSGLSQAEVQVLQALGARRETLDQRATQMETQTELMSAAERRLDERLAQLRQLESTVNTLLGQLDEAQERRLANLVDVYQRMRAKDAATVFDGLEDGVMVQVASRMRQQNLAEVMGNMEPTRARRLTQMLAELSRPPADGEELLQRSASAAPAAGR
jgi:flagellar motility protein MotE (MotC chaperone)